MKLNLEVQQYGDATVVHCRGRLVYRDEAAALTSKVSEILPGRQRVVIDLSSIDVMDSAGLGELVAVFQLGKGNGADVSLAAPKKHVFRLLQLTNLTSLFEIHARLEDALMAASVKPS